ncbi:hypothetical protein DEW08_10220 [Azospirillum thermophilum]|uniref:Peptidase C14 caspase domain-containing protein n=2 Tax=Azospirillum thermophilum TaxID=2202148 RepID=A0A2S2CPW6_9PROT|nr:hypothetical protein DEW08_10220 [Azospirillum thermophilum]
MVQVRKERVGTMVWRRLLVAAMLVVAGSGAAAGQERRVALVVGNGEYRNAGGASQSAAAVAANVGAMATALRRAGFEVTTIDNLDRAAMAAALARFRDALGQSELGFLYYSGGALSVGDREYLLPVDARLAAAGDAAGEAIELDGLLRQMQQTGRRAVVVLDPVPGNPLAERLAKQSAGAARPVLGAPPEVERLFVVYAHRPDTPPVAGAGGSGPDSFTATLAREMVKPGVGFRDSLAEVARTLVARTGGRQHPWLQDRLGGDLVLVPATAAAPQAAPTPRPPAKPDTPKGEQIARAEAPKPPQQEEAAPQLPPPPAALAPGIYAVVRPGMMFTQPVLGARGIRELEPGGMLTVLDSVPDSSWVRVRDRFGQEGFATASILSDRWSEAAPGTAVAVSPGAVAASPPPQVGAPIPIHGSSGRGEGGASGSSPNPPSGSPSGSWGGSSDPAARAAAKAAAQAAEKAEKEARSAQTEARQAAAKAQRGRSDSHWEYSFPNGDVYQGAWAVPSDQPGDRRQLRQGTGVYRFANGQLYEGEWADDAMNGYGVMSFSNGDRYAGAFRNNQPEGAGVYRYANGMERAGTWRGTTLVEGE